MPTLAILLAIYYAAGAVYQIVRGSHYVTYTAGRAFVYVVLAVVVSSIWLSLPFCGGLPVIAWILLGAGWFFLLLSLLAIGSRVYLDGGAIGNAVFFAICYVIVLLTANYC